MVRVIRYILLSAVMAAILAPASAMASECMMCHGAMTGRVEKNGVEVNLHIDPEKFNSSVHNVIDCADCHLTHSNLPHAHTGGTVPDDVKALVPLVSKKALKDPVAMAACVACHPTYYEALKTSVHGENVFKKGETDGPLCLDCHGSPHYIVPSAKEESPVNHKNVLHTCGNCHEQKNITEKYKLGEHVIEKYKESFHGKKYLLGHKGVPNCNTCHGNHAITKHDAPNSPVSGEGKVQTCRKCHEGASAKFAAAPAHKYIGAENPIPYYGEKLLIVLLLSTFAFIVIHVLLEIYSEYRDRIAYRNVEDDEEDGR